ncbi:MAG: hypothetical protein ABIJ48_01885 [Actinomycetota bacterium]
MKPVGNWGDLIANLSTGTTLIIYGAIFPGMVAVGSTMMSIPPVGWLPAGCTPQFSPIFPTFVVSTGAGPMAIGPTKLYPVRALTHAGPGGRADAIAETAKAVFFAPANPSGASPGERSATTWAASCRWW